MVGKSEMILLVEILRRSCRIHEKRKLGREGKYRFLEIYVWGPVRILGQKFPIPRCRIAFFGLIKIGSLHIQKWEWEPEYDSDSKVLSS